MIKRFIFAAFLIAASLSAAAQVQLEGGIGAEYLYSGLADAGCGSVRLGAAYCFNNERAVTEGRTRDHCDIALGAFIGNGRHFAPWSGKPMNTAGAFLRFTIGDERWKFGVEDNMGFTSYRAGDDGVRTCQMSLTLQPCVQCDLTERFGIVLGICPIGVWSPDLSGNRASYSVFRDGAWSEPALPVMPGLEWHLPSFSLTAKMKL